MHRGRAAAAACRGAGTRAARDSGFTTDVVIEVGRYPFLVEDLAYRIVREAIADAQAYEGTSRVEVDVREHRGAVHGRISGTTGRAPPRRADDRRRALLHLSLEQLASRVRLAEGDLDIRSIPGRGTLVAFRLPLGEAVRLEEERAAAI